ncbi:type IX secretion system membrane protein PorP/SprF [Emticicia sp. BO119]|uniref:type IX secretion system membrane protein PorP/SprF n=1 Tax=Emticicia sp. BO119 TaxID=2757768 RepID=UPI0015F03769|nr:type IX secretion system membrane protein PorP/SprF [Emticicia sp. BO119]MBA4849371.1 type IX secretion system membrane protein PorP/SprF [Emticicia sp. BO119]
MKRLIILLLITAGAAHAQTIAEFRQCYLDKQIINPALLVNAPANNALLSFSPGSYTLNYPKDSYRFNNYQFLASGTYHPDKSPHHFGAYIWGQQQVSNSISFDYAYEIPIDRHTNIAFGANIGVYNPLEFMGGKVFRYGAGVALQNKNKENYIGLSFPHIVTSVNKGDFSQSPYKALIVQGGYTFYLPWNIKFIPAAYLQLDITKKYGSAGQRQFFATDLAFRYKELIYVNGAVGVKNFNFSSTGLQRFGVGIKPKPEIMFGYQRDALDATDFRYHSIWARYFFLTKSRTKGVIHASRPVKNNSQLKNNTVKQTTNQPKTPVNKPKTTPKKK